MKSLILSVILFASSSALACIPEEFEIRDLSCTKTVDDGKSEKLCVSQVGKIQVTALTVYKDDVALPIVIPIGQLKERGRDGTNITYVQLTGDAMFVNRMNFAAAEILAQTSKTGAADQKFVSLTGFGQKVLGLNWNEPRELVELYQPRCAPPIAPVVPFED